MQKSASQEDSHAAPPVQVRALRKVYGDVVAVDGIDFSLRRASIAALLGGNGAGKTTTKPAEDPTNPSVLGLRFA